MISQVYLWFNVKKEGTFQNVYIYVIIEIQSVMLPSRTWGGGGGEEGGGG